MRTQHPSDLRALRSMASLLQQPPGTIDLPPLRAQPDTALLSLRATQANRRNHRSRTGVRRLPARRRAWPAALPRVPVLARARRLDRRRSRLLTLRRPASDLLLPSLSATKGLAARSTVPALRTRAAHG